MEGLWLECLNGENPSDLLRDSWKHIAVDTAGGFLAGKIGDWYGNGDLNFITHKLAHTALGAGIGLIQGDIVSGAMGALLAETIADLAQEDVQTVAKRVHEKAKEQNVEFGSKAYHELVQKEALTTVNFSKIATATALALSGQNVHIGMGFVR